MLGGCEQREREFSAGAPIAPQCADDFLLPSGILPGLPDDPDFLRRINSTFIADIGERSLWCGTPQHDEAYRLLYARSWDGPVFVRIFRNDRTYALEAQILSGGGGPQPDRHIARRVSRQITRGEWLQLTSALDDINFWRTKTTMDDVLGNDGATWTFEGRRGARYFLAQRWAGRDGFDRVGELFLTIAGIRDDLVVY